MFLKNILQNIASLIAMYPDLTKVGMIVKESANNLLFGGSLTSQVPPLLSGHHFHLEPWRGRSARFLSCSVSFLFSKRYVHSDRV